MSKKFVVTFAKFTVDKDNGIVLQGVFLGGLEDTSEAAENLARDCVNTVRGGVIMPKVSELEDENTVIDALYDATEKFEKIVLNMVDANDIINRRPKRLA